MKRIEKIAPAAKITPVEKMSKKQRREYYGKYRRDWGGISPVTRRSKDPKAYDRAKFKRGIDDDVTLIFGFRNGKLNIAGIIIV